MPDAREVDEFSEYKEGDTLVLKWSIHGLQALLRSSEGEQKSGAIASCTFGDNRWQAQIYFNNGRGGISVYLHCIPTGEEKPQATEESWTRNSLADFSVTFTAIEDAAHLIIPTKEAFDHPFSHKAPNWGWSDLAKRDALYAEIGTADSMVVIYKVTEKPLPSD